MTMAMNPSAIGTRNELEALELGDERGGAGRHRHGDGEDVADQQGSARDLGGDDAEVVAGDEVRTTG